MKDENLNVVTMKKKKYSQYMGEISFEVDNIIKRNFHCDNLNEKLLTDITKF